MGYIMPISEVRRKLFELVKKISSTGKHLIITRNGKPKAVMLSAEEMETLEIKADQKLLRSILKGRQDIKKGNLYSHKELFTAKQTIKNF